MKKKKQKKTLFNSFLFASFASIIIVALKNKLRYEKKCKHTRKFINIAIWFYMISFYAINYGQDVYLSYYLQMIFYKIP